MNETRRWLGYLRGSRTGTLFLIDPDDAEGTLTIGFNGGGDVRLAVAPSSTDDNSFSLLLPDTRESFGNACIESRTATELKGSWSFTGGAAGVFDLTLHRPEQSTGTVSNAADQLRNREVPLGAITLYRSDLVRLIAEMESLVPKPCVTTIRATENDQIVIEPASKYLSRQDYVDVVRVITISTSEVNDAPLKRIANVILNDDGSSQLVVTSPDEIWTSAAAVRLEQYLGQFSSKITGWLRRNGLNFNSFILAAIVLWMPDFPLVQRIAVFFVGVIFIAIIAGSHKLIPYNRVYLDPDRQKRPFAKEMPSAVLATFAAAVIGVLSNVPKIAEVVQQIYQKLMQAFGL